MLMVGRSVARFIRIRHALAPFPRFSLVSFGSTITLSTGRIIPVRWIGEQHVREDLGFIPSLRGLGERNSAASVDGSRRAALGPARRRGRETTIRY